MHVNCECTMRVCKFFLPVEGGKAMGVHYPAVSVAVGDVVPLLKKRRRTLVFGPANGTYRGQTQTMILFHLG